MISKKAASALVSTVLLERKSNKSDRECEESIRMENPGSVVKQVVWVTVRVGIVNALYLIVLQDNPAAITINSVSFRKKGGFTLYLPSSPTGMAVHDRLVAVGTLKGSLLFRIDTTNVGFQPMRFPGMEGLVITKLQRFAWSVEGRHLASSVDDRLLVWEIRNEPPAGRLIGEFREPSHIQDLTFFKQSNIEYLAIMLSKKIKVYNRRGLLHAFYFNHICPKAFTFAASGHCIVIAGEGVGMWSNMCENVSSKRRKYGPGSAWVYKQSKVPPSKMRYGDNIVSAMNETTCVAVSSTGLTVTGSRKGTLSLWRSDNRLELFFKGFDNPVKCVAIADKNQKICAASTEAGSNIRIWSIARLRSIERKQTEEMRKRVRSW